MPRSFSIAIKSTVVRRASPWQRTLSDHLIAPPNAGILCQRVFPASGWEMNRKGATPSVSAGQAGAV